MPGQDGRGPMGKGRRAGKGLGPCGGGQMRGGGNRRGCGLRRGGFNEINQSLDTEVSISDNNDNSKKDEE